MKTNFNSESSSFNNINSIQQVNTPSYITFQKDQLEQMKRHMDKMKQSSKNKKQGKISSSFTPSKYLFGLYNAKTPFQVYSVVRMAQGDVKLMNSLGASDKQIAAAKRLIRQLSQKADLKVGCLKKEQRLEERRQMEANANHLEEVSNLAKEIKQTKKSRKARERSDLLSSINNMNKKETNSSINSVSPEFCGTILSAPASENISTPTTAQSIDITL